ncbi:hypothetical protein RRF57_002762 [Xylaria bambusicola]|uniref:Uncharacterized protein n=1 Tax=Xylaria bambusicola TaxID=326684 RepID=A0AAN7Z238_9PEZI
MPHRDPDDPALELSAHPLPHPRLHLRAGYGDSLRLLRPDLVVGRWVPDCVPRGLCHEDVDVEPALRHGHWRVGWADCCLRRLAVLCCKT